MLTTIADIKKTPCKKCGKFEFEQRYHAIVKDVGYIDEGGEFVAEYESDVLDNTNGIEVFECRNCDEPVEVKDEETEDDE